MHVVIFEGNRWHTFAPISLSRPLFTLATGMSTLLDKQVRHLRPDPADAVGAAGDGGVLPRSGWCRG